MTFNKIIKSIFVTVAFLSSPIMVFSQIKIGESFSNLKASEVDSSGNITVKLGTSKKSYQCIYQGISYWITLDAKKTIDFVMTNDHNFSPPEGLKIGSTYDEVLKFNDPVVTLEKGWASHIALESGWHAAFEPLDSRSNPNSVLNSKIKFFFKRYDLR